MDWSAHLQSDETLRWEGRPAPRCYTFRNWRHSLFGFVLLSVSLFWLNAGGMLAAEGQLGLWRFLPVPFVVLGVYLSIGHLLLARLQWEGVFFAITDRRLLLRTGKGRALRACPLSHLRYVRLHPLGEALGTLRVHAVDDIRALRLCCLEHPQEPLELLRRAIEANERRRVPDSV